jgi:hypothetical protein
MKAISEFSQNNSWCKLCSSTYAKERRSKPKTDRESFKNQIELRYGITFQQYEKMRWDQNGLCAICGRPQRKAKENRLHIDHDHKTGVVRGLLCRGCNMGLGHFEDDIERLESAIRYLKQYKACITEEFGV